MTTVIHTWKASALIFSRPKSAAPTYAGLMAYLTESFGPFSNPIEISSFIQNAGDKATCGYDVWNNLPEPSNSFLGRATWNQMPAAAQKAIEHECE